MLKKIGLVIISTVFLFSIAGCGMAKVNEEKDNQQIIAVVNGEKILKEDIMKEFDTYDKTYDFSSDEEQKKNILQQMVVNAVNAKLIEQKAGDLGVSLSEEDIREIDDQIQLMKDETKNAAEATYAGEEDPVKRESQVEQTVNEALEKLGIDNGVYRQARINDALKNKVVDKLGESISVTDDQAKERYDTTMKEQKELFDSNETALTTYQSMGEVIVYVPGGARYVKSIQIAFPEEVNERLIAMEQAGLGDYGSQATIVEFEKIQPEAEEALEKAKAGEDFDKLIEEYSDDAKSKQEPVKTNGYVLFENSSAFSSTFVTKGMELEKIGDITDKLVNTPYGYYIIQYVGNIENGEIPYEDVKEALKKRIYNISVNKKYEEQLKQWKEESQIEEYPERTY